jgi:hypothetical protein
LLDSDKKHFCGDIIITDPCYIAKDNDWPDFLDAAYDGENEIKAFIERDSYLKHSKILYFKF